MKFWLKERKVDGLRIDALANLFEDESYLDEPLKPGVIQNQVKFYDFLFTLLNEC